MGILRSAAMAASFSTLCLTSALCPTAVAAQETEKRHYDLPAQPLATSLRAVAVASGRSIAAPAELVSGVTAPPLIGEFTAEAALAALLANSGLRYRPVGRALVVERDPAFAQEDRPDGYGDTAIVVTGSRIRGAPIASPVITIDQEDIRNAGQATMGDVVRSIPQSFGGGQNPGIGLNVPAINGTSLGGGSSINLRGLGSDATLTLLNGKRLAYSSSRQSIDVSTIPIGALDRIEIVADGASALYGSDAVGGVANIILKRDMDGFETRARVGGSTDGGYSQQQFAATGGATWGRGGFIAAYEFNRNTAVDAADRDYAATRSPGLTLYPAAHNHNALISAHQDIGASLEFSVDALFNRRRQSSTYANNPAGDLMVGRTTQSTESQAYAIAPTLKLDPGAGWNIVLTGSYAEDQLDYRVDNYVGDTKSVLTVGCYCNEAQWVELAGDGPVFALPAGSAKLALGAGYRKTDLVNERSDPLGFARSQSSRYAYGEISLPLVSSAMHVPGIHWLSFSAAARHENYDSAGSVTTPKLGLIWAPNESLDLKASWGRSFRAPTLLQRYQPPSLILLGAGSFGAVGAPPGSAALFIQGGTPDLAPERATSWSISASVRPAWLSGFSAEASYFETRYVDRIVTPISFLSRALSDPSYTAYVTRSPSPELIEEILSGGDYFVNATGAPLDPATVVAVIDNSSVNAGRQTARGVDILAAYESRLGQGDDRIALMANVSHLVSERQITATQPELPLAGILFNPPRWRGRASASWTRGGLTFTGVANYTGELADTRFSPAAELPDQVRFDLVARYRTGEQSSPWLRGLDLTLGIENVFDAEPPPIFTSLVGDTPYDSTNYAPLGRVISLSVAKSW